MLLTEWYSYAVDKTKTYVDINTTAL